MESVEKKNEIYLTEISYWLGQMFGFNPQGLLPLADLSSRQFNKLCHMILDDVYKTKGDKTLPEFLMEEVTVSYIRGRIRSLTVS